MKTEGKKFPAKMPEGKAAPASSAVKTDLPAHAAAPIRPGSYALQ